MAIQNRRGAQANFDPNKLLSGEVAIATDYDRMYYCTTAGDVKTVATMDDLTGDLPTVWNELQTFKMGVIINSNKMANNAVTTGGNDPAQAKYFKVARVVINGSFNRVNFSLDYFGTGTTPKKGNVEGYVYTTSNYSTFSAQTYIQTYVKDKFTFAGTEIKIVKSASATAGKSIWDIYVWLSDYGSAYVNGIYGFTESGELFVNPDNGAMILVASLPAVASTFSYGGFTYTVSAVDNGVVRTYTTV